MTPEDIANRFDFHQPDDEKRMSHEFVRNMLAATAKDFEHLLPEGREKSLAITKLEEAMFWANAALARSV